MWRSMVAALLVGCGAKVPHFDPATTAPLDTVIVPGCPSKEDGALSGCQWQRAIWAHQVWESGITTSFITSGGAVHGRHIEAEALKAGMVALGVPEDRIYTDTQAMHSDQNASYSLAIADSLGLRRVGVASHGGHAKSIVRMLNGWGHAEAYPLKMPLADIIPVLKGELPEVRTEPVPAAEWLPLGQRERVLADRLDIPKRAHSLFVYTGMTIAGTFGTAKRPMPPQIEPTLCGARHRIDTQPWPAQDCDLTD